MVKNYLTEIELALLPSVTIDGNANLRHHYPVG